MSISKYYYNYKPRGKIWEKAGIGSDRVDSVRDLRARAPLSSLRLAPLCANGLQRKIFESLAHRFLFTQSVMCFACSPII